MSDSIKADLQDYLTSIGQGDDVSIGGLPDTPDDVVVLEQYEGLSPIYKHEDTTKPAYERPSIQARTRSFDPEAAQLRAKQLMGALCLTNVTLNGTFYQRVEAITSVIYIGLDTAKRHQYTVNFGVFKNFS
jgi:hypothetical protein